LTVDNRYKESNNIKFTKAIDVKNDADYPWHTWVILHNNKVKL